LSLRKPPKYFLRCLAFATRASCSDEVFDDVDGSFVL
jgi:hypothetical protein